MQKPTSRLREPTQIVLAVGAANLWPTFRRLTLSSHAPCQGTTEWHDLRVCPLLLNTNGKVVVVVVVVVVIVLVLERT